MYHTCRFPTLTINFSEVWPRQILELGKQFNQMIRLSKNLEGILARRLEDVLKTYDQDEYIDLDQDVFWRRRTKANIFVLMRTSSEDDGERRLHQDEWLLGSVIIPFKMKLKVTYSFCSQAADF